MTHVKNDKADFIQDVNAGIGTTAMGCYSVETELGSTPNIACARSNLEPRSRDRKQLRGNTGITGVLAKLTYQNPS